MIGPIGAMPAGPTTRPDTRASGTSVRPKVTPLTSSPRLTVTRCAPAALVVPG